MKEKQIKKTYLSVGSPFSFGVGGNLFVGEPTEKVFETAVPKKVEVAFPQKIDFAAVAAKEIGKILSRTTMSIIANSGR